LWAHSILPFQRILRNMIFSHIPPTWKLLCSTCMLLHELWFIRGLGTRPDYSHWWASHSQLRETVAKLNPKNSLSWFFFLCGCFFCSNQTLLACSRLSVSGVKKAGAGWAGSFFTRSCSSLASFFDHLYWLRAWNRLKLCKLLNFSVTAKKMLLWLKNSIALCKVMFVPIRELVWQTPSYINVTYL